MFINHFVVDFQPSRTKGGETVFAAYVYDLDLIRIGPIFTMICQDEKKETCVFALSLMKDLMEEKLNGAIMKPKYIMADNAAAIENACAEVLEGFTYVTCQQHFRMSYKEKARNNFIGTEKDKESFIGFAESLLTDCQSPAVFEELTVKFENWIKEEKKRYSHLKTWWEWWHRRRNLWSDAYRDERAPKTNEAEKGNSRYRGDLDTTKMNLLKATESHTFEHLTHVMLTKMLKQGSYIPSLAKRGRSLTLQKIDVQEQRREMESPVSQKHAKLIAKKLAKKAVHKISETESSISEDEKDPKFMDVDADKRMIKFSIPKVGSHKPPEKKKNTYPKPKNAKPKTDISKIESLLKSNPKITKQDNGEFVFPSNTGHTYQIRLKPTLQCDCPAFKYNTKSQDQIKCKHIVCVLIIIGVKDEPNFLLTDEENRSIDKKVQNFCAQSNEKNIQRVLGGKGKQQKKNPLPPKPDKIFKKFKTKDQALQSLKKNNQHCKWIATKAQNNMSKCPSHAKSKEKREKGSHMEDDISTGQLIFVAYYQRILKEKNQFGCVGERRMFHTSIECVTNLTEYLKEWTSIISPSTVKCLALTNREIEFLQKQFTSIYFEKEDTTLQESETHARQDNQPNPQSLPNPPKRWLSTSSTESETNIAQGNRSKRIPEPKKIPLGLFSDIDEGKIVLKKG